MVLTVLIILILAASLIERFTTSAILFLQAFVKHAYKFGVVYMKENQQTEEELFGNETHSKAFDDFLDLLGERVRLRGFDKYRAGLDSNNDLTGTHSVYTKFHDKEVMFHVSTLLPFEEFDAQKVQLLLGPKHCLCQISC